MKSIAILGSTGSIGTQAIAVIKEQSDKLKVSVLTANHNADLLIEQCLEMKPKLAVIANKDKYQQVKEALAGQKTDVQAGSDALQEAAQVTETDIVLTALVGYAGLKPTLAAIKAGKDIAIANKETLVVAGRLVMKMAKEHGVAMLPVDSEHSALFQCLIGEPPEALEKIILTASGGPFRGYSKEQLSKVTRVQALKHPNWDMGAKVTIDSASLMNKGFEALEARWLFNMNPDQIEVVVHPQSIVHSAVQFKDGSIKAQLGLPDMKLPIQYALSYPNRFTSSFKRFSFFDYPQLTFEQADRQVFGNLQLAFDAMHECGNRPCAVNAANEVAVAAFLQDQIGFLTMTDIIAESSQRISYIKNPVYDDYVATDTEARRLAQEMVSKH